MPAAAMAWPSGTVGRGSGGGAAASPAAAWEGAGDAPLIATMGWADAVRLHLPLASPTEAATTNDDGVSGPAAAAAASPCRPATPSPPARTAPNTGSPGWLTRPGRPRSPSGRRLIAAEPPSSRGPPAPVPLGVPRRAPSAAPAADVAPPGCPPVSASPPVVPTDTTAPGLHRPMGDDRAAATAAWQRWLRGNAPTAQRDLARPAALAAQTRLWRRASLAGRARMAACEGGGAGLFLGALPTSGRAGTRIGGDEMRAAVRMWLGVAARPSARPLRCRCGAVVRADGAHFLGECSEQVGDRTRRHHAISHLVADALRASGRWAAVELELRLGEERQGSLRPDLCATRAGSGVRVWGDVSIVSPLREVVLSRVVANPRQAAAAAWREGMKAAKYGAHLPPADPPSTFTPLVWEAYGRVGPATAEFLAAALGGPTGGPAHATLLRRVSVALWRANARAALTGVRNSTPTAESGDMATTAAASGHNLFARISG